MVASLTMASPPSTVPSTAIMEPVAAITVSPTRTSAASIWISAPSRSTQISSTAGLSRCLSRSSERRSIEDSRYSPSASKNEVVLAAR